MTETPKCIHNGAPCCRCMPNGPCTAPWQTEKTPEEALSAALHRAEPEMRPLTREEVEAHCADGIDAMPLWVEYKHVPDISRWMCVDAPEHFSTWETIKILIREHGKNYGETRRCWPRKPTPEQMAAWKWEE